MEHKYICNTNNPVQSIKFIILGKTYEQNHFRVTLPIKKFSDLCAHINLSIWKQPQSEGKTKSTFPHPSLPGVVHVMCVPLHLNRTELCLTSAIQLKEENPFCELHDQWVRLSSRNSRKGCSHLRTWPWLQIQQSVTPPSKSPYLLPSTVFTWKME